MSNNNQDGIWTLLRDLGPFSGTKAGDVGRELDGLTHFGKNDYDRNCSFNVTTMKAFTEVFRFIPKPTTVPDHQGKPCELTGEYRIAKEDEHYMSSNEIYCRVAGPTALPVWIVRLKAPETVSYRVTVPRDISEEWILAQMSVRRAGTIEIERIEDK